MRSAMVEAASALSLRYGQALGPLLDHVDDLLARFGNRGLGDTTARVGRDPVRKMQPGDRLLGAYLLCRAEGIAPRHVSLGVVLGAAASARSPAGMRTGHGRWSATPSDTTTWWPCACWTRRSAAVSTAGASPTCSIRVSGTAPSSEEGGRG
ncbi:hypothetical protein G7085_07810 [Tessaracoccus sp. HDW20]|nr:hypothetical protein [Tessaracoccus coleopterorum]NHB84549.1 hypothetical protein [Tessaracoccus coleopterorum]